MLISFLVLATILSFPTCMCVAGVRKRYCVESVMEQDLLVDSWTLSKIRIQKNAYIGYSRSVIAYSGSNVALLVFCVLVTVSLCNCLRYSLFSAVLTIWRRNKASVRSQWYIIHIILRVKFRDVKIDSKSFTQPNSLFDSNSIHSNLTHVMNGLDYRHIPKIVHVN